MNEYTEGILEKEKKRNFFFNLPLFHFLYSIKIMHFYSKLQSFTFKHAGKGLKLWKPVRIYGRYAIEIGDFVSISAFVHIWGNGGLVIGDRTMIASNCVITTLTHDYNQANLQSAPAVQKKVIIGKDVWIGAGAIILPGITIGDRVVVGAGSIVTKDIPDNAIVVGNPARIIKFRK